MIFPTSNSKLWKQIDSHGQRFQDHYILTNYILKSEMNA